MRYRNTVRIFVALFAARVAKIDFKRTEDGFAGVGAKAAPRV